MLLYKHLGGETSTYKTVADVGCLNYLNYLFCSLSHSDAKSLQAPPPSELQAVPAVQPEVHAEPSGPTEVPFTNMPVDPPSHQPQSSTAGASAADSTAPNQPLNNQTPEMRQRLGEDLFRLVQVGTN